jgi:hypothetical protein
VPCTPLIVAPSHGPGRSPFFSRLLGRPSGQPIRRYERARPGDLLHVDVKKLGQLRGRGGWRFPGCDSSVTKVLRSQGLRDARLRVSMGRVGTCADNPAMESFFSLLQKNVPNGQRWHTRAELRLAIVVCMEKTSHRRRRQDALGRMTSIEVRDPDPDRSRA